MNFLFHARSSARHRCDCPPGSTIPTLLLVMKLTAILLTLFCLQVSATSKAQQITLSVKNALLEQVIEQVHEQSGYSFLYSVSYLKKSTPVTVMLFNVPIDEALKAIFKDQPFSYEIKEKIIVITPKKYSEVPGKASPQSVKGTVRDSAGKALQGVTVRIKGTTRLVITDAAGHYKFDNITPQSVLVFTMIGYRQQEIEINDKTEINMVLLMAVSSLHEVNVILSTGYQDIPLERATGSFAQPIKAMYDDRVSTDVLSKLSGITSGVIFNANTATAVSGQSDINIRGRSTIYANDQPLIVVDNFPYSGDINNINPNDVESVTILKDAASASIWGVRAGNGVIVITTKKGKINQLLKVGFNSNVTIFAKPDLNYNSNQLDASSFIFLEKYLFNQGFYDSNLTNTYNYPIISPVVQLLAAQRAGTISADNVTSQLNAFTKINVNDQLSKYFFRNAVNQQYALNFSGGSDKTVYYFSAGYDKNLASLKDNATQRITINSQNTFYLLKNLELNVGLNAIQTNNKSDNTYNQTRDLVFPYTQIADVNGNPLSIANIYSQSYTQNALANGFLDWSFYPLKELGATTNTTKGVDIRFSTGLKYTFVKGLSGEIKYQYENSNLQNRVFESQQTFYTRNLINEYSVVSSGQVTGYNVPLGGILNLGTTNAVSNNVRAQLNYNLNWKDNSITALAGYELSQVSADFNSSILYGYNDNNATFSNINPTMYFPLNPGGYSTINSGLAVGGTLDRILSSFANAAYTYRDRYTFTGSARIDGSNYFGVATRQKSLPLWSAGGKWAIDKEPFYKLPWLPVLNIRASFGYNGNLDRSVTGVTTLFNQSNDPYTNLPFSSISNIGNPDLRWEKTGITNLAVDFGLKNNNITGSIEYYLKKETDLLGYKIFPENAGITSLEGNYSDMKGHGFDISVTSRNLSGELKWSTTVLLSHATDKVTRFDVPQYANQVVAANGNQTGIAPVVGKPVFGIYSYQWGGLDHATGDPIGYLNGAKSEDYSNINQNTPVNQLVYSGPARPVYFGGLNNRFSYKGFSLDVQVNYKLGYYFMRPAINYYQITGTSTAFLSVNRDFNKRWMQPGDETKTNVPSLSYPFSYDGSYFYQYSSVNVDKGDNIRLQDVNLSYTLSRSLFPRLPFNNLKIFIYANNIGILWRANHDGIDPDAIPAGPSTAPNPRSVAIGLKGTF